MIRIGVPVSLPGTGIAGVVCDIGSDGFVYVMWGDNNRKRFRREQVKEIQK